MTLILQFLYFCYQVLNFSFQINFMSKLTAILFIWLLLLLLQFIFICVYLHPLINWTYFPTLLIFFPFQHIHFLIWYSSKSQDLANLVKFKILFISSNYCFLVQYFIIQVFLTNLFLYVNLIRIFSYPIINYFKLVIIILAW